MTDAVVTLKKGEGRYLQKGGPWIYDNEIADISPGAEDGGLVLCLTGYLSGEEILAVARSVVLER